MICHYRTVILAGAAWICAGLILLNFFRIRGTHRPFPFYAEGLHDPREHGSSKMALRKRLKREIVRIAADLLILTAFLLSPLYPLYFNHSTIYYAKFIAGFCTLIADTLFISVIVDMLSRRKYYRETHADRNTKLKDFIREMISVLIVSGGLLIFDWGTILTRKAGGSLLLQILAPVTALLLYSGTFRLLRRIRMKGDDAPAADLLPAERKAQRWKILIRSLQAGTFLFFWIRIVLHIENDDFPMIYGIPDTISATLTLITLVTCAFLLIAGLQLLRNDRLKKIWLKSDQAMTEAGYGVELLKTLILNATPEQLNADPAAELFCNNPLFLMPRITACKKAALQLYLETKNQNT